MPQWRQSTVYTGPQNPPNSFYYLTSVASDSTGSNLCAAYYKQQGTLFTGSGLVASSTGTNWGVLNSSNNETITNGIVYNSDGTILFQCGYAPNGVNFYIINQYTNSGQTVVQVTNPSPSPYWNNIATNSTGTTLVAAGSLNSQFGIWTTTSNNGSALGSSWTNTNISASSDTLGSTPLAVSSNATTIIVATPGIKTTTNTTSTTVTYNTTNNIYVSSANNSSNTFTQVTGLPSINWTSVACSYDGTILLVAGNTTTTITTTTTNPTTGQPQTFSTTTNTNGVVYLSMNGGISFTLVTSSSISSSSSNTWNSVAIASNSNGTNGFFVAGSSGIYVSYGSTGTNWTNIISTPNIYYMTCDSYANFVLYNTNSNILYTATPTTAPTTRYKGKMTLTTSASKGTIKLEATAPDGTTQGDLLFITDPTSPYYYELATISGLGSIYIYEALKQSYPAGSSIYIYPPNTTISEILAEQNLPIPIADICFVRNTPIETDQGIVPIHKIDPKIHSINNKKIIAITKSVTEDKFLVCFEKHALGKNIPSTRTIVSKYHKIQNRKGKMMEAYKFLDYYEDVKKIDYDGEILYNILMNDHETVNVNNLVCETLHPDHEIAKLYKNNYSKEYTDTVIAFMNYSKKASKQPFNL